MKTRQFIIAAAAGLLSASPVWALNGSYGEGSMWTDLIAFRDQLAAQRPAAVVSIEKQASYEGDLFEQLKRSHRKQQHERALAAEGKGPMMAGEHEPARLNQLDLRPYVSIYEQLAMPHGEGRRS